MKNSNLIVVLAIVFMLSVFQSCKVSRFVFYNFADIGDYKKFPKRDLPHSDHQFSFHERNDKAELGGVSFEDQLEKNKTVAFMIIQNDTVKYEKYFKGYDKTSIVPSFSMAKSITSILIGCVIDDGLIKSVDEPVTQYIPELKKNGFDWVTIKHLLQMTSGIKFNEGYANPFGDVATFYYGTNLRRAMAKMKLKREPGKAFEYLSGNTQLLGLVLERALKNKTLTAYLQEKLWQPLGMEYDASWSIDRKRNGIEKSFCCINARARDFAKIGRLFLNKGKWNGKQLVPEKWVEASTKIDESEGSAWFYQYQWWLPSKSGDFMAVGILGQYIYVNPSKNIVMVRLGQSKGNVDWGKLFIDVSASYE